jgi:phage baseplate assembly protein W
MDLAFPYRYDARGRTAETDAATHLTDLIEQVLFTAPGERVNRPNFGSGVSQLVFGPNSVEIAATTQLLIQSSLQQWLGDLIQVEAVRVENIDSTLQITIQYIDRRKQQRQTAQFRTTGGLP